MGVEGLFAKLASIAHPIYFPPLNHHFIQSNAASIVGKSSPISKLPRVAIDISGWIAQSCHGFGATLLDERHLHNYGRVEMEQEDSPIRHRYRQEREMELIAKVCENIIRKLKLMLHLGMEVFVVLDGRIPPIKHKTSYERKRKRQQAAKECDQVHTPSTRNLDIHENEQQREKNPDTDDDEVSIDSHSRNLARIRAAKKAGAQTSQLYSLISKHVLHELRKENIPFLVAPYEADGQLAYLSGKGYVDWIFSEDSDMIGHGVECLIYKLEELKSIKESKKESNLDFVEAKLRDGKLARGLLIQRHEYDSSCSTFSLQDFSNVMLAVMSVAAGCDYCSNLPGIGLVKARSIIQEEFLDRGSSIDRNKTPTLARVLKRLHAESYSKVEKPSIDDYMVRFLNALIAYRHPVVFDPVTAQCVIKDWDQLDGELMTFKPYADIVQNRLAVEDIVGKVLPRDKAIAVAEGWIDPKTDQLLVEESEIPNNLLDIITRLVHRENTIPITALQRNPGLTSTIREEEEEEESLSNANFIHQFDTQCNAHKDELQLPMTPCKTSTDDSYSTNSSPNRLYFPTQAFSPYCSSNR